MPLQAQENGNVFGTEPSFIEQPVLVPNQDHCTGITRSSAAQAGCEGQLLKEAEKKQLQKEFRRGLKHITVSTGSHTGVEAHNNLPVHTQAGPGQPISMAWRAGQEPEAHSKSRRSTHLGTQELQEPHDNPSEKLRV